MTHMFEQSNFNSDISKWDVSKVKYMDYMFYKSEIDCDLSNWVINHNNTKNMFKYSPIEDKPEYQPKINHA
jgi:surface protein